MTSGRLGVSGGALQVGYPQPGVPGGTITAVPQRVLPTTLGTMAATNGGVLWISYLFYNPGYPTPAGKYYRQSNLGFYSGASGIATSGSEVAAIGSPNTSASLPANFAAWIVGASSAPGSISTIPSFSPNIQLVVIKLVVDATTNLDSYYGWFNLDPALLGNGAHTPDISTANLTNRGANLSAVNALRFQAGNYNANGTNAFFVADELRLGGSFAAVTPSLGPPDDPPSFKPVANQVVEANSLLRITNHASDSLAAGESLQFDLLSGPVGARVKAVSPTNALFSWVPACDQGGTTNLVTIRALDTNTFLGGTQSFLVVVSDCVQVSLGRAVVRVGEATTFPMALLSTVTLSNLAVAIEYPAARFTNPSLLIVTQQVAAVVSFNATTNGEVNVAMDLQPNHALRVSADTVWPGLTANANQPSAFVPIGVTAVVATRPDGTIVTNAYGVSGRTVVVGEEPLLEALSAPGNQVSLLQYAPTGSGMQIESRTDRLNSPWQFVWQNTQTNLMQASGALIPAAPAVFFRAIRSPAGP